MHIDQQRAAGDDLGDLANLLGARAGAGYPSARSDRRQGRTSRLPSVHQAKHRGTGDEAAGGHRRGLHDRRSTTRHDLATVGTRLLCQHRDRVHNL
jgi:hypothetical protein